MTETFEQRMQRQLALEKEAVDLSYERLMNQIKSRLRTDQADELSEGKLILIHALDLVTAKIEKFFSATTGNASGVVRVTLSDFHTAPRDLAYIIIATLIRNISRDEVIPTVTMISRINKAIFDSIAVRRLDSKGDKLDEFVKKRYARRGARAIQEEKLKIAKQQRLLGDSDLTKDSLKVGAFMLECVIASGAGIIEERNVRKGNKTRRVIMYTDECYKMVLQSRELMLGDYRKYPVLITKPKAWDSFKGSGGYWTDELYKMTAIKTQTSTRKLLKEYFKRTDCSHLFEALNALQDTAWVINKRVFEVINYIFNSNMVDPEAPRNNPKLVGGLPYNGMLDPKDFVNISDYGEVTIADDGFITFKDKVRARDYYIALEAQTDLVIASNSKALMANLVLQNAREYLEEEEIYFSYQYDFRGRIYPIQQHLQPQGTDHIKALLQFKNGTPVDTEEAKRWFLIHGANCYGYDKDEYDDRITKITEKTEEIKAIAQDPIGSRNLWKDADSPFLYLAWCFEYSDYLASPNDFVSRLPIALDATCSGIQIYSGLLRDKEGAEAVNVIGDTRQDIYQRVADKVNEYLRNGDYPKFINYKQSDGTQHEVPTAPIANSLKDKVSRKLTKRNTMTQPYSVTTQGMRDQLRDEFDKLEAENDKFWVGDNWLVSMFLADLNAKAIQAVVRGARVGQEYLIEVTSELSKQGKFVFYHAPLTGFPVLQKIHRSDIDRISTPVGKLTIKRILVDTVDIRKMKSGIAPNFVHSMDAALLAETVLRLKARGCTNFHLIHDSYGVPAQFVEALNEEVREAYVELFEADPLTNWFYEVNPKYPITPDQVMINTLDLGDVRKSKYIFS